jgi:histidinol dehydrogenase
MAKNLLRIRRIHRADPTAPEQLADLQAQLSAQGNIVSARGQALTEKVFGEALAPVQVVERICADVHARGLAAVLHYTAQFDRAKLTSETLRVRRKELVDAHSAADPAFLEAIRRIRRNIMTFQYGILPRDAILHVEGSHELRMRYRPMHRVGVMVPGGAAAYPSTLLMTICPAQAAGVKELAVVMPPTKSGAYNKDQLAVCHELGIEEVYRIGGAQAVAALAYGVDGIPAVDMIVGPGNLFVALAKRHVYGRVAIDCIAGPSEIVVVADDSACPKYVATDLLAQAEHAPGASILVTWHQPLLDSVTEAMERQLAQLERGDLARESLENFGAFVQALDLADAAACVNQLAPEHLHIATRFPDAVADRIENAGAIFLGHYTPVALGDYAAGPSHVLPTGGTARFTSGLSAIDFLHRSSVLCFGPEGLASISDDVRTLAQKEGLTAHALSVDVRVAHAESAKDTKNTKSENEIQYTTQPSG